MAGLSWFTIGFTNMEVPLKWQYPQIHVFGICHYKPSIFEYPTTVGSGPAAADRGAVGRVAADREGGRGES